MEEKNENQTDHLETLDFKESTLASSSQEFQDIPQTFFKPIEQVQNQQQELIQNYNEDEGNIAHSSVPDLSSEVESLEKKLAKKKYMMPLSLFLFVVVLINILWFLGVQFFIVPKYESYIKISNEIKENYDDLKRKVDAIIGE